MTRSTSMVVLAAALLAGGCATTHSEQAYLALQAQLAEQQDSCARDSVQATTRLDDLGTTSRKLSAALADELARGQVTIARLQDRLRLSVVQELLFDSGSIELRAGGTELLDKLVAVIFEIPGRAVTIEGHTDDVPIGPAMLERYPTNWELSTSRATTVVRYLQAQGVQPMDLGAVGFGEYRPVTTNETSEGRQRNRRIDVILAGVASEDGPRQARAIPLD